MSNYRATFGRMQDGMFYFYCTILEITANSQEEAIGIARKYADEKGWMVGAVSGYVPPLLPA